MSRLPIQKTLNSELREEAEAADRLDGFELQGLSKFQARAANCVKKIQELPGS